MDDIKLLATDLDGTLIGPRDEHTVYGPFHERIERLSADGPCPWVVCTGRSLTSFHDVFRPLAVDGAMPNYVITKHAYAHSVDGRSYRPHFFWNIRIRRLIWSQQARSRKLIGQCHRMILSRFRQVQTVHLDSRRLCLRTHDPDRMADIVVMIRSMADAERHLLVFDHITDVDVRHIPFTKGLAVAELARHLGVGKENILAVGDGLNDICMLDGTVAAGTACPQNAHPVTMQAVSSSGGHISLAPTLEGTVEAIDAHLKGTVCSELPASWQDAVSAQQSAHPVSDRGRPFRHRSVYRTLRDLLLLAGGLLALIVGLAATGLLGKYSDLILAPLNKLINLIAGISA